MCHVCFILLYDKLLWLFQNYLGDYRGKRLASNSTIIAIERMLG